MTLEHSQELFRQAGIQLEQAKTAIVAEQYGECEKLAYQASESIAAGYLSNLEQSLVAPTEAVFNRFAATIREPIRHPDKITQIRAVVGDVSVLREIYEPNLLHETTKADAEMILNRGAALLEIVRSIQA